MNAPDNYNFENESCGGIPAKRGSGPGHQSQPLSANTCHDSHAAKLFPLVYDLCFFRFHMKIFGICINIKSLNSYNILNLEN